MPVEYEMGASRLERQSALTQVLWAIFGDSWVGQQRFTPTAEIDALHAAIKVRPGATVLDLWCGAGGPAIYLAQQTGCRVVGIDPSVDNVRRARAAAATTRATCQAQFFAGALATAPFPAGSFDAIVGHDAFFLIANKLRLFSNCWRLLRPGGRMACTVIVDCGAMASQLDRTTQLTWSLTTTGIHRAHRSAQLDAPAGIAQPLLRADDYCAVATLAGLHVLESIDRTESFRALCARWAAALLLWEEELIAEQGRERFDRLVETAGLLAEWAMQGLIGQIRMVALHPPDGAHPDSFSV